MFFFFFLGIFYVDRPSPHYIELVTKTSSVWKQLTDQPDRKMNSVDHTGQDRTSGPRKLKVPRRTERFGAGGCTWARIHLSSAGEELDSH